MCELADALRDLGNPVRAEELLRTQLEQQNNSQGTRHLLELSLAESLFAQGRLREAKGICSEIDPGTLSSKVVRLRYYITLARLYHLQSDLDEAFQRWNDALAVINTFQPAIGITTRIVHRSNWDILRRQGRGDVASVVQRSQEQVACFEEGIISKSEALN